jgi:hypothetical protein
MGEVIVANRHGIGLNPRRYIEIGIRHDLRLTAGMDQKTRMAVPLDEKVSEGRALARTGLNKVTALLE